MFLSSISRGLNLNIDSPDRVVLSEMKKRSYTLYTLYEVPTMTPVVFALLRNSDRFTFLLLKIPGKLSIKIMNAILFFRFIM